MRNRGVKEKGRRLSFSPDLLRELFFSDFSYYIFVFAKTLVKSVLHACGLMRQYNQDSNWFL